MLPWLEFTFPWLPWLHTLPQIKLPEGDTTNYCGLCGNGDGNAEDDMMSSNVYFRGNTRYVDDNSLGAYANSWAIDP